MKLGEVRHGILVIQTNVPEHRYHKRFGMIVGFSGDSDGNVFPMVQFADHEVPRPVKLRFLEVYREPVIEVKPLMKSSWVTCPICNESDMQCETDDEGRSLIQCVNLGCASNIPKEKQ
jgi:hypothetical protein